MSYTQVDPTGLKQFILNCTTNKLYIFSILITVIAYAATKNTCVSALRVVVSLFFSISRRLEGSDQTDRQCRKGHYCVRVLIDMSTEKHLSV